jgi:hypothetical protein
MTIFLVFGLGIRFGERRSHGSLPGADNGSKEKAVIGQSEIHFIEKKIKSLL